MASGGGEPARLLRKHKDGGVILSSWPEVRHPSPPALLHPHGPENNARRVGSGPPSGPSRPPSARRPAWAVGPGETKGPPWRPRPQPLLAARPPLLQLAAASEEERVGAGGRRGAGLACGAAVLHDSVVFGEGPAGLS